MPKLLTTVLVAAGLVLASGTSVTVSDPVRDHHAAVQAEFTVMSDDCRLRDGGR